MGKHTECPIMKNEILGCCRCYNCFLYNKKVRMEAYGAQYTLDIQFNLLSFKKGKV